YAQSIASLNLPVPGAMVGPSQAFVPVLLKGMTIHPDNPLQFDFIIDSGNTNFTQDQIKDESQRLVKYFLASMTIPKDDLWVNLSPYEKDRIIPEELGKTELGRDMLAQDYILKQLTASLMYPEKELGKAFWDKVYKQAKEKYGTTEIPVDTFNKVWILPETATVYEHGQTVYIVEAKLKVMLDSDYVAMQHETKDQRLKTKDFQSNEGKSSVVSLQSSVPSEIIKEIILPAIEKEVNEGQTFAPLRQIYHSLILAKWYKETIKNSLLSKIYVDQKKIAGVNLDDATLKDQIYAQYMEAYKKGVFNYIKEDYDRLSRETIPRKYFSGGEMFTNFELITLNKTNNPARVASARVGKHFALTTRADPQKAGETLSKESSSPVRTVPELQDLLDQGKTMEAIQGLVEQQVAAGVAVSFSAFGAYYDDEYAPDRRPFRVQINPMRHPDNKQRAKTKQGAEGCFLCAENMPDEEEGLRLDDKFTIFPNPGPYEKNHVVITDVKNGYEHPFQTLNKREYVKKAINLIYKIASEGYTDYNISFNSLGAAATSRHFHFQGFEAKLPVTGFDTNLVEKNGVQVGFVRNYPANVIVVEGKDRDKVADEVFRIVDKLNTFKYGEIIPHNVLFKATRGGTIRVFIFPRGWETPGNKPDEELITTKFGIVEMGGTLIVYKSAENNGKKGEGSFEYKKDGKSEWRKISKELFEKSIAAASLTDQKNVDLIDNKIIGFTNEEKIKLGRASASSSPVVVLSPERRALLDQAANQFGLGEINKEYLAEQWRQSLGRGQGTQIKIILDENNPEDPGNFILASRLTDENRRKWLGSFSFADIRNTQSVADVIVTLNSLDGGIGEAVNRLKFKQQRAQASGESAEGVRLGAKGTDLGYDVTVDGKTVFVSIAEAKILKLIAMAREENNRFQEIHFQPLVNYQSKKSYEDLLASTYLYDRL
ncbi:MAG: hypothetical protein HY210_01765, partial [Candidatus Omnitrophica bacterium]|nr:hypothetical protein [Candidatus Omnitrophota bacterium]